MRLTFRAPRHDASAFRTPDRRRARLRRTAAPFAHRDPPRVFYFWNGERPRQPNAPQLEGTAEIRLEDADRASGYWTTRSEADLQLRERTSGVYLRADPEDMRILDGGDATSRARLLAVRLVEWKAISNS